MLRLQNASLVLASSKVLFRNLNFELKAGDLVHLVGPNGIGKSSFLKTLAGHLALSEGSVLWSGKVKHYLPQLANLNFHVNLTLRDVLKINLQNYCEQSVLELGLLDAAALELSWNSASGGERQRTLLTQTFLSKAEVLLLDEPTNHLDKERSKKIFELMTHYVASCERAIVYVSHLACHPERSEGPQAKCHTIDLRDYR